MAETHLIDVTGRTVFRGTQKPPGGGSQPVKIVRVPIAFDDAGLVLTPGVVLYTPTPGDMLIPDLCSMSIPTIPFAGSAPIISYNLSYSDLASAFSNANIAGVQDFTGNDGHTTVPVVSVQGSFALFATSQWMIFPDATPLRLIVDDGSGGNPGLSAGAGEVVLYVIPAA